MNHQITERLECYPRDRARAKLLELQMQQLTCELEAIEPVYYASRSLDGLPHANWVSDRTGTMAARLADGILPPEAIELQVKLEALKKVWSGAQIRILAVEIFLDTLSEKERWVIECRFFKDLTWNELANKCESGLGIPYSVDTLKRLQRRALEKGEMLIE